MYGSGLVLQRLMLRESAEGHLLLI